MKKRISFLLCLLLILTSCSGIGQVDYREPEEEILAAAKELVPKSLILNDLFFGDGIPVLEGGVEIGVYREADASYLASIGFESVADILAYASGVYSTGCMEDVFGKRLGSVTDGSGILSHSVFYDETDEDGNFVRVMVSTAEKDFHADRTVYDDRFTVVSNRNGRAEVEVSVTVYGDGEGEVMTRTNRLILIKESAGWRLDTPTYMTYFNADVNQ